jgi:hypothetical protein
MGCLCGNTPKKSVRTQIYFDVHKTKLFHNLLTKIREYKTKFLKTCTPVNNSET